LTKTYIEVSYPLKWWAFLAKLIPRGRHRWTLSDQTAADFGRKLTHAPSHVWVVDLSNLEPGAEIVEACREGDRVAFRELYDLYKDRVYSIALYFFHGDHGPASDVTQQVFLKLLANISRYRGEAVFSTWLYRLVVNACLDEARIRKPLAAHLDRSRLEAVAGADSPEARYSRTHAATSVRAAVALLPPKYRIAVLLRYFDDLSYEEMAKALRCSMGTVASRLSRGHKMLAERLKGTIE
jgi:RNA polymerase sigma-70 factor (ECF subfamily)